MILEVPILYSRFHPEETTNWRKGAVDFSAILAMADSDEEKGSTDIELINGSNYTINMDYGTALELWKEVCAEEDTNPGISTIHTN